MAEHPGMSVVESRIDTLSRLLSLNTSPRRLLDMLTENGLFFSYLDAVDKVEVQAIPDAEKMSSLLSLAVGRMKEAASPQECADLCEGFLHVLEKLGPALKEVVKEIRDTMKESPTDYIVEDSFAVEKSTVSNKQRKYSSLKAYRKLRFEHAKFVLRLKKMLKSKRVPLSDLKQLWCNISDKRQAHPAMNCNTIDRFMVVVSDDGQLPALQYQFLEDLAKTFLKENGQQLVNEYEGEVKKCLEGQLVHEVKALKVKVNIGYHSDVFPTDESSIHYITETLSKVFQFSPEDITLISARKGCIELLYMISVSASIDLLPHTANTHGRLLLKAGIVKISLDSLVVWNKETGTRKDTDVRALTELSKHLPRKRLPQHTGPVIKLVRGIPQSDRSERNPQFGAKQILILIAIATLVLVLIFWLCFRL